MSFALLNPNLGNQQIAPFNLPDTVARHLPGTIVQAADPFWGGGEFIYLKAGGTIGQYNLVAISGAIVSGQMIFNSVALPNTANLGQTTAVAMTSATVGQFFWACISGAVPVNCTSSIAAGTAFGVVAAGQGGVLAAGKQINGARIIAPATQTVVKAGCIGNVGSTRLLIPNADGWFAGIYLSGTGIPALTTVTDIDASGTVATLSLALTAVPGSVTGTYNNATVFYNIAHINRPFAQGAIT